MKKYSPKKAAEEKNKSFFKNKTVFLLFLGISILAFLLPLVISPTLWQVNNKQMAATTSISPLIFGTNLGLFNSSDSFFSPQIQSLVKQMHIQLIRFPISN